MKNRLKPGELTLLGLLTALLLVMSVTPLGYLSIGPLAITFNIIPVAIAAAALGPTGGAIVGGVFGMTSFLQCLGIGGTSAMGVILLEIDPFFAFVQRFVPRLLTGWLSGYCYRIVKKTPLGASAGFLTGFICAFFNTLLFMTALLVLFGHTQYVRDLIAGRNVVVFICAFVGINALVEMLVSTVITGTVCTALERAKLIGRK